MLVQSLPSNQLRSGAFSCSSNSRSTVQRRTLVQKRLGTVRVAAQAQEEPAELKPLKATQVILSDSKGVGVLAIAAVVGAVKLVGAGVNGILKAGEKDWKPAMEKKDENIAQWKKTLAAAVDDASASARKQLEEIKSNANEAWQDFETSKESVSQKLAKEAEAGAANWEKTTSAIASAGANQLDNSTNMVKQLAKAEEDATKLLTDVGKNIKGLSNRAESLQNGWANGLLKQNEEDNN